MGFSSKALSGCSISLGLLATQPLTGAEPILDAFKNGKMNLDMRARAEYGDVGALDESYALTLRSILGFTTAKYEGISAKLEFTDTHAADESGYNGVVSGDTTNRTVIADPVTTELNQLSLSYENGPVKAVVGRQRYILDNSRFIGNIGWRQNEQTFDMALLRIVPLENFTLEYAYLDHINRIFADDRDWDSQSHLIHATYSGLENFTFTAYDYYLDMEGVGAPALNNTFGGSISAKIPLSSNWSFLGYGEAAYQSLNSNSALFDDFQTNYIHLTAAAQYQTWKLTFGYEHLGSDGGNAVFQTPLSTAHAFNGFADSYLNNGGNTGLHDYYASISKKVGKFSGSLFYHHFTSHEEMVAGDGSANELDFLGTYTYSKNLQFLVKLAFYNSEDAGAPPDTTRLVAEVSFTY